MEDPVSIIPIIDPTSSVGFSAQWLQNVVMGSPMATAIVRGDDYRILLVNNAFEYLLGYGAEDVAASLPFLNLVDDYQQELLIQYAQATILDRDSRFKYVLFNVRKKTGEKRTVYVYIAPVMGNAADGPDYCIQLYPELSHWFVPFTSFDTRELFLELSNSEHFGTFEWLVNSDNVIWSDGIYRVYELENKGEPVSRKVINSYTHPDDLERIDSFMKEVLQSDHAGELVYRIIVNGKIKTIHSIGRAIKDAGGNLKKFVGSIRDITEQRIIENNLKSKLDDLNKSNRALEEFAYTASHDMQEPLRKITTFSTRLSEKYKDQLAGEGVLLLEKMNASAENMRQLINNLLDFSRITTKTGVFTTVNLNFILHQVKIDLELIIEETGTTIISGKLPTIQAIGPQMKQLFFNLINNSIKFRKEGVRPEIAIEERLLSDDEKLHFHLPATRQYYRISFSDNGIGFEEEYATRIFQIFQRLHGKSEYPGSGIGLAICKKIVEHHQGIIYAESVPGQGARFIFILPESQDITKGQ
jgi:PAS domain S-box-containing protein